MHKVNAPIVVNSYKQYTRFQTRWIICQLLKYIYIFLAKKNHSTEYHISVY